MRASRAVFARIEAAEMAATLASPFTTAEAGAGSPWGVRLPSTRMSSGLTPSPSTARFMASIVA